MLLTDTRIRGARPDIRPRKLFDGGGLFLLVAPNGSRNWRFKYRFAGREKLIGFGRYPEVTLKAARERRDEARRLLATGVDPSARRQAERVARLVTFEAVAREWLDSRAATIAARTLEKRRRRFDVFLLPHIGSRPIAEVTAPEILAALRIAEARGRRETAHRLRSECGAVFRYAIATGRAERDPAADLRGALAPIVVRNHPAITEPAKIGELLRAIFGYRGHASVEYSLKVLPYVFVRPGELRFAQWREFDLDRALWRIPAGRMKMRQPHLVPLARQVVGLLEELRPQTGQTEFLFPSVRSADRVISDNTFNAALRRLGFTGDEIVAHGFRSMASTSLNEQGWHPDLIELQLAHAERNEVRSAYNRAQRIPERTRMMQAWADYLDSLRESK
ncbi:MAG: integrase arm-type DNA-binding domain-containing protein [Steroidobacteraceae bacterium]